MSDGHDHRGRRRSSRELRAEIEATRARLSADIDAAREKLSPRGLQREAIGALRGVRHEASGTMSHWSHSTDSQVSHLSRLAVDAVKRYPVVTTLLGLGLAMVALSNGRRSRGDSSPPSAAMGDTGFDASDLDKQVSFGRPTGKATLPPPRGYKDS